MMDTESSGDYIALVVRLEADPTGSWHLVIDNAGASTIRNLPLLPLALVIRLWRSNSTNILRGTIRLMESDQWIPIQSNIQLERLIQAWLVRGSGLNQNEGDTAAANQ